MRGLVLEGGGTKGAYQIGAYKALKSLGIDFQGVSGTSIGALNGAYIVQDDIEIMEDIWLNYDYTYFMDIDEETYEKFKDITFSTKNINGVFELMKKARKNQGIDITPLRSLIEKTLDEKIIRDSTMDFGLVTVYYDKKLNPHQLYIEDIPDGRLIDYLIASASLPIFQTNVMDDRIYLDGVFSDNIPVGMLKDKGYKDIVAIRLVDDLFGKVNLNRHNDINVKVIVPSEYLGGSLNKDRDSVEKNINLGYLDTIKSYDRCDGVKYFFELDYKYSEDYCFEKLRRMDCTHIENLCNILNIKREPNLRTLMEIIVPKVGDMLSLNKNFSYQDLFYRIYETKLEENHINRVQLYDFNKVVDIVNNNIESNNDIISNFGANPIIPNNINLLKKNKTTKVLINNILMGINV